MVNTDDEEKVEVIGEVTGEEKVEVIGEVIGEVTGEVKDSINISMDDKYKMVDDLKKLSKDVHLELFSFFKNYNINYTTNKNGVFVNINDIDNDILVKLQNKIKFYVNNEKNLNNSYLERFNKNL